MDRILISGYYGFQNNGDDALLLAITNDLKKQNPNVSLTVLSKDPKETRRRYGLHAINRMNPFSVFFHILRCRMLLSGGGTLIQDRTSTKSLLYYLGIIRLAKLCRKKVMLYSNGIGPLDEEHIPMTKKILNSVDLITLRDAMALEELKHMGVDKPEIRLTADPAFNLVSSGRERGRKLLSDCGLDPRRETVCISVRQWRELPEYFCDAISEAADALCEQYGMQIMFVPMQPSKDNLLSHEICKSMKHRAAVFGGTEEIGDMLALLGEMKLCIGMRLHSLIYAAGQCVPVVGLVYDPKVAGFMDYIGQKHCLSVESLTGEALVREISEVLSHYDEIKGQLVRESAVLKQKAEENAVCAMALMHGKGRRA